MPRCYSELLRVILQGDSVTSYARVAPQFYILSETQASGPVFTISKLSYQSTITDKRSSSCFTFKQTQLLDNNHYKIFKNIACTHSGRDSVSLLIILLLKYSTNARSFIILQVMPLRPGHNTSFSI